MPKGSQNKQVSVRHATFYRRTNSFGRHRHFDLLSEPNASITFTTVPPIRRTPPPTQTGNKPSPHTEPADVVVPPPRAMDVFAQAIAKLTNGSSPEQVNALRKPEVRDPGIALTPPYRGYTWDSAALSRVMEQTGVADALAVIETAISMDQTGRYLDAATLLEAARKEVSYVTEGYSFDADILSKVLKETRVTEETALLRLAQRYDDGDKFLSENELLKAAQILRRVVEAHDFLAITRAVDALRSRGDIAISTLTHTPEGLPVDVVRFSSTQQPPAMRVVVTGGVHGDEPCGAASALLLVEQLSENPALRQDIEWVVVPVVNPRAYVTGTRRTPENVDLNREFEESPDDPLEVNALQSFFRNEGPFELALDLHSGKAKRNGFWVLQHSRDEGDDISPAAISRFATQWPVLRGDSKPYTLLSPGVATSKNPGTLKGLAMENGTRWAATVEAPGSVSYREQVLGENDIVHQMVLEARRRVG